MPAQPTTETEAGGRRQASAGTKRGGSAGTKRGAPAGTKRGGSPKPDPRARLSREQVARAALELLDRDGLGALSMRRLADELGVGTMTLYGYFSGKDDLLDAVIDAAVADREPVELVGPWQDQLRKLMQATRRGLGKHPSLVKVRSERPVLRPEALRFAESGLTILRSAGFGKAEAARAFRLLFTYVFGYVSFSPEEGAEDARRDSRLATAALPPSEYPTLTDTAAELADAMAGDVTFDFGLDRIIDGLEAQLRRTGGS